MCHCLVDHSLLSFVIPSLLFLFGSLQHSLAACYVIYINLPLGSNLDAITRFRNETLRVFGVLEIRLSGKYTGQPREYLAGHGTGKYSVADIGTWTWVKNWQRSGFTEEEMGPFPHLLGWISRIAERPAVKIGTGEKYTVKK